MGLFGGRAFVSLPKGVEAKWKNGGGRVLSRASSDLAG
jgi:hypothetical protein